MTNILFNTYPAAFHCPGGGEIQLLKTKEALEKLGHNIILHDNWNPRFSEAGVAHFFSVQGGTYNFHANVKYNFKLPLVVSPILWPNHHEEYPIGEIKMMLDMCDVALPNSQLEANLLSQVFNISPDKFHVAYNGIDDVFTKDEQPSGELFRSHFNFKKPFLLCVGNIEDRKNQFALARAIEGLDIDLVLIGNIRNQDYYKKVISTGSNNIHYLGHLDHHSELLRSAYLASEAFILPSKLETPGLAALEAAALGCKIIITQEGSTKEYFEDYVTYLDPADDLSIKSSIENSLNQKNDTRLQVHIKKFTWEHTAKQTLAGYDLAIKRNRI